MRVTRQQCTGPMRHDRRLRKIRRRRSADSRHFAVRGRLEQLEARHLLSTTVFMAGIEDNFALPTESPSPSSALAASDHFGLMDFDVVPYPEYKDKKVAHTFSGLWGGLSSGTVMGKDVITGATLKFRALAGPTGGESNDGVTLGFFGPGLEDDVWTARFEELAGAWNAPDSRLFTLDLGALPRPGKTPLDLIPLLNQRGFLDVKVKDDTGVDFYQLTIDHITVWDGGGDGTSWSDPNNWAYNTPPQAGDDVIIPDVGATSTVVLSSGDWRIASLVSDEAFRLAGGLLEVETTVQVNNALTLSGGTLADATVLPGNGGQGVTVGLFGGPALQNVTMDADLVFPSHTYDTLLQIKEGLTLNGTATLRGEQALMSPRRSVLVFEPMASGQQRLDGTGTIVFDFFTGASGSPIAVAQLAVDGDTQLTIGPGITLRGQRGLIGGHYGTSGSDTIVSQGTISADQWGGRLTIQSDVFNNEGTVEAKGHGNLFLESAEWSSTGTIRADGTDASATVTLNGTFRLPVGHQFELRGGGQIRHQGTLENAGNTVTIDTHDGSYTLQSGRVNGGTLVGPAGSELSVTYATLQGVTADIDLDFPASTNATLWIEEGLTLNGTATLRGERNTLARRSLLVFQPPAAGQQRLDGTGTVVLDYNVFMTGSGTSIANAQLAVEGDTQLTVGPGITLRGKQGLIGGHYSTAGTDTIVNQGTIAADVSGYTLTVQPDVFTNEGTLEARHSGGLTINPVPTNFAGGTLTGGVWQAFAGSLLRVATSVQIVTNTASIVLDGAGSRFENAGAVSAVAGLAANLSAGSLTLRNGRDLSVTGPFANAGTMMVGDGSTLSVSGSYVQTAGNTAVGGTLTATEVDIQGGTLAGSGTVNGNVINSGQVSPGMSPGVLHINGDYTQSAEGMLYVELGGTLPGQFDQLGVAGTATLDGTLHVGLFGGFDPDEGDAFPFVICGSRNGDFAVTKGLLLEDGAFLAKQLHVNGVTLLANEAAVASIDRVSVPEGDAGSTDAVFTVTLDKQSPHTVSVDYATADGTATAGSDYTATSGTLTFAPGVTMRTIVVSVLGDTLDEADETFTLSLTNPSNASIAYGQGTGTIADDDAPVSPLVVTNTHDSGPGSLRSAITYANTNAGPDTITFNIPATDPNYVDADAALPGGDPDPDVFVIRPLTQLPALNDPTGGTTIDGRSQAAFSGDTNPFGLEIVLDGSAVGGTAHGLTLLSNGNQVLGINIQRFSGDGIRINGGDNSWIAGNYIGTDATGSLAAANGGSGVDLRGSATSNRIGTNSDGANDGAERNVISGNTSFGISIRGGGSDANVVAGNFIGTDATGRIPLGNTRQGVVILLGARSNRVGSDADGAADEAERNIISANSEGIRIEGTGVDANVVAGNYIGTDRTGGGALGNVGRGIVVNFGSYNTIGGTAAAARNVISANGSWGIEVAGGATGTVIQGNYIGTDATGSGALGNGTSGIWIHGSHDSLVGGVIPAARNVISANGGHGIQFAVGSSNNRVQGNYIGTDLSGSLGLGNRLNGVTMSGGATNNLIGGNTSGARNVLSGNMGNGIHIGGASHGIIVAGNYIGTDLTGTQALPNLQGVYVLSANNTIGGTSSGMGNLISGNRANGIVLDGSGASGNVVQGNYIGTAANGTAALGNQQDGVHVLNAPGNTVGGSEAAARNVIAGNGSDGIRIQRAGSLANWIAGNYIGADAAGAPLGNAEHGVHVRDGASLNLAGTDGDGLNDAAEGNLIANNGLDGVRLSHDDPAIPAGTSGNVVAGNEILRNAGFGVFIGFGASDNRIGSLDPATRPQEANSIRDNGQAGVMVGPQGRPGSGDLSVGNTLRGNRIYSNGGLGIDLGVISDPYYQGVTANDPGDADEGANRLQNKPVLHFARTGGETYVAGGLQSSPKSTFVLDFYSSPDLDPGGHGEGASWLGSVTVTTDDAGNAVFGAVLDSATTWTDAITATATGPLGDTSEFSRGVVLDRTRPSSQVLPLPIRATSLTFPVTATGSDPDRAGQITSGIGGFDIYVSVDGAAFALWQALPPDAPTADFHAESNRTYAFRSIAYDRAGNVENKGRYAEATIYVPDLSAPATAVTSVNAATATFQIAYQGADVGSALAWFELYVEVDGSEPQLVQRVAAGAPDAQCIYRGSGVYQAIADGAAHTYRFYTIGIDAAGNREEPPAASDEDILVTALFAVPDQLEMTDFDVQRGAAQRSFIRYVDIVFNTSAGLDALVSSVQDAATPDRIELRHSSPAGTTLLGRLSLADRLRAVDRAIAIDFGAGGLGGAPTTTAADGYYELAFDLDGDGLFESFRRFYRLLGDTNGDRRVDNSDLIAINAVIRRTAPATDNEDINGDSLVNTTDLVLANQARGNSIGHGLHLDD